MKFQKDCNKKYVGESRSLNKRIYEHIRDSKKETNNGLVKNNLEINDYFNFKGNQDVILYT